MTLLNIWSVGHFVQWTIIGRYFLENRYLFWILSIGWEVIELGLPFEFAVVLLFLSKLQIYLGPVQQRD